MGVAYLVYCLTESDTVDPVRIRKLGSIVSEGSTPEIALWDKQSALAHD